MAIGVIPETNNAKFEFRLCDDGKEREFLTVEGLVWDNKWKDAPDILKRDLVKPHSMELHNDYEGEFSEEDNLFHFTKFKFFGACALGEEYHPAMESSTIEVQNFSFDEFKSTIQYHMEKFKDYLNNENQDVEQEIVNINETQEGGNKMNKEDLLSKFSYLKGDKFEEIKSNLDNYEYENLEKELFALSVGQIFNAIYEKLKDVKAMYTYWSGETVEIEKYWLYDILPSENIAIVEDNIEWGMYYGIPYTMNGDEATLNMDGITRYVNSDWRPYVGSTADTNFTSNKVEFVNKLKENYEKKHNEILEEVKSSFNVLETEEYKTILKELDELKSNYQEKETEIEAYEKEIQDLKNENESLSEFKSTKEEQELVSKVETIASEFSMLTNEEIESVKTKALAKEVSVEDYEKELYALVGKKSHKQFSLNNKPEDTSKCNFSNKQNEEDTCPYPSLKHLFVD